MLAAVQNSGPKARPCEEDQVPSMPDMVERGRTRRLPFTR
jgi:hypothetical protein